MASKSVIDTLLDEAFAVLQHDTGPHDPEYVHQRGVLRKRFASGLKTQSALNASKVEADARAWGERHGIRLSGTDLDCAFEDAATFYR